MSRVMNGAVTKAPETSRVRNNTGYLFLPSRLRRGVVLKWLRRTHGWLGLWGGALGLLFGFTGILMNHRAVMKIPALKAQQSNLQIALENPTPADPNALADWLQQRLQLSKPAARVHADQAQKVPWGTGAIVQPERWQINFINPQQSFQAEYWVGNAYVSVKQSENNAFAFWPSCTPQAEFTLHGYCLPTPSLAASSSSR